MGGARLVIARDGHDAHAAPAIQGKWWRWVAIEGKWWRWVAIEGKWWRWGAIEGKWAQGW